MRKIKKINVRTFSKSSGKLIPFTFNKDFPIKIKRIFFIYGKKNNIRGEHAHKKCSQIFFPIAGKMLLKIKTPNKKKEIILKQQSKKAILVPPKYWCGIKFLVKNSILMVLCDKYYDFGDYLESFEDYKKYIGKK